MQSWTRPYERQILGALSQLSVEVRARAEAVNSGDLEAFMARTAEDVEFTSLVAEAEGRTFRGHAGVRAWWVTVLGAFQDPRWEVLDVRESGDRAVVKSRLTATLADTELDQTMWMAARLREGKLGWWAFFRTEQEALEVAGLRE
jgi:ketosteroid isomerase-like protein